MKCAGSLEDVKELVQITKGFRLYQKDFLDELLPVLTKKILPLRIKADAKNKLEENRSGKADSTDRDWDIAEKMKWDIASIFHRNAGRRKIGRWKYALLRNEIVDQKNNTFKTSVIQQMERGLQVYIDFDAWRRTYPVEVYGNLAVGLETELREYTPVEMLCRLFEISDKEWPGDENTYREELRILFKNYNRHNSKKAFIQFIIYVILCSIFEDPNYINAYKLPEMFQKIEMRDRQKERKIELFTGHEAVNCMKRILQNYEMVYVLGGHGCGKESLVRTLEHICEGNYNFSFYKFDYNEETLDSSSITWRNVDDARNNIADNVELSDRTAVLVFSNWNGRMDHVYKKIMNIRAKKILLTTNEGILDDKKLKVEQIIDLNRDFQKDRKRYSEKIFNEITGMKVGYEKNWQDDGSDWAEELLSKVGYHFYASILLAKAISKQKSFDDFYRQTKKRRSVYLEEDVLPYIRNIGLDVSGTLFNVLILLSVMPDAAMRRDFFFELLTAQGKEWRVYEQAIRLGVEKSLLYIDMREADGRTEIKYRVYPHVRQTVMALSSFDAAEFIHLLQIRVAEKIEMLTLGETNTLPKEFSRELISLVEGILENLPYRAGKYTSFYLTYIRFLWVYADLPKKSLKFLKGMEQEVDNKRVHLLNADLCQIYRTFGHIYGSTGDIQAAQKYLERAVKMEQKNYISSSALLETVKIKNPEVSHNGVYKIETGDLRMLEKASIEDNYELMALKMQIAKMYIIKLKEDMTQLSDSQTALAYLKECIVYFQREGYVTALATCFYLRAVLLRMVKPSEVKDIENDLNEAEALRTAIRGERHSLMLPIYFEKAEMAAKLNHGEEAEKYYKLIKNIRIRPKGDYTLTEEEIRRLNELEQEIIIMMEREPGV